MPKLSLAVSRLWYFQAALGAFMCGVVHSCQHNYRGARRRRRLADQLRTHHGV
jgi:hypothetical protein